MGQEQSPSLSFDFARKNFLALGPSFAALDAALCAPWQANSRLFAFPFGEGGSLKRHGRKQALSNRAFTSRTSLNRYFFQIRVAGRGGFWATFCCGQVSKGVRNLKPNFFALLPFCLPCSPFVRCSDSIQIELQHWLLIHNCREYKSERLLASCLFR